MVCFETSPLIFIGLESSVLAGNSGGGMRNRLQENTSSQHVEVGGAGPQASSAGPRAPFLTTDFVLVTALWALMVGCPIQN